MMLALALAALAADWHDVAARMGINATSRNGGTETKKFIVETTGSGIAAVDYNNDGFTDVVVLSGPGAATRLYRNEAGRRFRDVSALLPVPSNQWQQGICAGDYDGDGRVDLLLTRWGGLTLLRNDRHRRFVDATRAAGLQQSGQRYNTGCAFLDYDRDGDLDLVVANYLEFDFARTPPPGANPYCFYRGIAVSCGPRGLPFARNLLYRNESGRFVDVSQASGIAAPFGHYGLGVVVADYDNDGWLDIYIACDQTPSLLYMNQRDGTFREEAVLRGAAFDENGRAMSGMGADAADYDGDGHIDLFRTNFSDERETLYRNQGQGLFDEVTARMGLAANTRFVGWGCNFFDFDLDGWLDLLLVNGHVFPEADRLQANVRYRERAILYRSAQGKRFIDISEDAGPAANALHSARGLALLDIDNDGVQEVLVNHQNEAPALWKQASAPKGNWLTLTLEGAAANRLAVGARVRLHIGQQVMTREVRSGSSYLSQSEFRLHFGLGAAMQADRVEVLWPDGSRSEAGSLTAGRHHRLRQQKPGI
jgi:enediyne biosynthesis protein E4